MEENPNNPTLSDEAREALLSAVQDATFDLLVAKPRRKTEFYVHLEQDGRMKPFRMQYQAMAPEKFDELLAAHVPTNKQRGEGYQWNKDTFPQALISAMSLSPKLTVDQAATLLKHPNWATGESDALFRNALNVQNAGLDVPFSASG